MLNTINTRILVRFLKTTLSSTRYTLSSQIVIIHWARAIFDTKDSALSHKLYSHPFIFSRLIINSPPLKTFNFYYR
ncbi:unnamed protein product [Rhizophagus irregularis]|nr:unnamed protein product [Rhizophagus irregularis]